MRNHVHRMRSHYEISVLYKRLLCLVVVPSNRRGYILQVCVWFFFSFVKLFQHINQTSLEACWPGTVNRWSTALLICRVLYAHVQQLNNKSFSHTTTFFFFAVAKHYWLMYNCNDTSSFRTTARPVLAQYANTFRTKAFPELFVENCLQLKSLFFIFFLLPPTQSHALWRVWMGNKTF